MDEAHATKQLHGLATHPLDADLFATCGDDATVRVWSIATRKCVMRTAPDLLGAAARAIAWSPDGTRLAVGLGGDADSKVGESKGRRRRRRVVVEGLVVEGWSSKGRPRRRVRSS